MASGGRVKLPVKDSGECRLVTWVLTFLRSQLVYITHSIIFTPDLQWLTSLCGATSRKQEWSSEVRFIYSRVLLCCEFFAAYLCWYPHICEHNTLPTCLGSVIIPCPIEADKNWPQPPFLPLYPDLQELPWHSFSFSTANTVSFLCWHMGCQPQYLPCYSGTLPVALWRGPRLLFLVLWLKVFPKLSFVRMLIKQLL